MGERSGRTDDADGDAAEEVRETNDEADSEAGVASVLSSLVSGLAVVDVEVCRISDWASCVVSQLGLNNDRNDHTVNSDGFAEND